MLFARILIGLGLAAAMAAQVTSERLLRADAEPQNWLTYNGAYHSRHYRDLDQITRENVQHLQLQWVWQSRSLEKFEATPLVVDGVIYTVQMPNDVVALDARTGRIFWTYRHPIDGRTNVCCGRINRGLAILGETLFMGTIDGKLVALDAVAGSVKWEKRIVDPTGGYALTVAPLVVKDKIVLGSAGGEYGIRGFIAAYNPVDGDELWRFHTIPGPGEPGHATWGGDSWKRGGGSIWLTGSYDPDLDLMYWGVGNPAPDWNGDVRPGDNLYTDSVVALDPDDGSLQWHFQFTPHDVWDFDSVQIPVLVDRDWQGEARQLMLWANRNGFFYVLDRATGEYLQGSAFAKVTWASGLDERGRPMRIQEAEPKREGVRVWPGVQGATNWYAPSYNPDTDLFYMSAWEYSTVYHKGDPTYERGNRYVGSLPRGAYPDVMRDEAPSHGAILALDPATGEPAWEFRLTSVGEAGVLTTSGGVLFTGTGEGAFLALDAESGDLLWRKNLGGRMINSPITCEADGRQLILIGAGNSLFAFGLPD